MKTKTIIGNSILVLWLGTCLFLTVYLMPIVLPAAANLLIDHSSDYSTVFVLYIMACVAILFMGRFFLEWFINKVWKTCQTD